jgi:ubiquinone/menaquinone biosynthesis C-methylase UbiE
MFRRARTVLEFTGERVIPGLVDPNLFNEHLARYRFAARLAEHARVLDCGCGSGYGAAELSNAASIVAMDISRDAIAHARLMFSRPGVNFLQGNCESLPFADGSFDLIVAFEVIEHLERWQQMLTETRRVLSASGVLLVSTPNKAWYATSRADAGPNPYHVREFEFSEFGTLLKAVFPYVHLWSQNHAESIAFVPVSSSHGILDAPPDTTPEHAHFFLAACSPSPIVETGAFAWLPSAGNILRERHEHITLLESEVEKKNVWLAETQDAHAKLQKEHDDVLAELHRSNDWAIKADRELNESRAAIAELQQEAVVRLDWVHDLEAQIARGRAEIERLNQEASEHRAMIADRTQWAESLNEELQQARSQMQALELTTLVRLGRKLRLIPGQPE